MLKSARNHYRSNQRLIALALRQVRRSSSDLQAAAVIAAYQAEAVALALAAVAAEMLEQGMVGPVLGRINQQALLTDSRAVVGMLQSSGNRQAIDRLTQTLVADAGRTASSVDIARRPVVTGHVRMLNLPSCSRCAVLAGRVYRWSTGFQRHPKCDCVMVPTTLALGNDLTLDGRKAALDGQVEGLSKADLQAIEAGADLGQVVNVRRRNAGLVTGSSVMDRAGRPTPAGIMAVSNGDRDMAVRLLKRHGYLF